MAALQDDLGLPYPAADGKASGSPVAERPRLLCLHSSGGSSEILRRQLQFARLRTALEAEASLSFLDGTITMDPAQPEAVMLQKFFRGCPNLCYLRLVCTDGEGNEVPVQLDTTSLQTSLGVMSTTVVR